MTYSNRWYESISSCFSDLPLSIPRFVLWRRREKEYSITQRASSCGFVRFVHIHLWRYIPGQFAREPFPASRWLWAVSVTWIRLDPISELFDLFTPRFLCSEHLLGAKHIHHIQKTIKNMVSCRFPLTIVAWKPLVLKQRRVVALGLGPHARVSASFCLRMNQQIGCSCKENHRKSIGNQRKSMVSF